MDLRSIGLSRKPEVGTGRKVRFNQSETNLYQRNFARYKKESSIDSRSSEQSYERTFCGNATKN